MILKMALCAAALFLLPVAEDQQKPEEVKPPQIVEKSQNTAKADGGEKSDKNGLRPIEENIISYTNAERKKRGLPPLKIDRGLMNSARKHCSWMARSRRMVHTRQSVGENIAMGQKNSQMVVRAWMNSSGHRANILNGKYKRIGAAAFRTPGGTIYWCQQFMW